MENDRRRYRNNKRIRSELTDILESISNRNIQCKD